MSLAIIKNKTLYISECYTSNNSELRNDPNNNSDLMGYWFAITGDLNIVKHMFNTGDASCTPRDYISRGILIKQCHIYDVVVRRDLILSNPLNQCNISVSPIVMREKSYAVLGCDPYIQRQAEFLMSLNKDPEDIIKALSKQSRYATASVMMYDMRDLYGDPDEPVNYIAANRVKLHEVFSV